MGGAEPPARGRPGRKLRGQGPPAAPARAGEAGSGRDALPPGRRLLGRGSGTAEGQTLVLSAPNPRQRSGPGDGLRRWFAQGQALASPLPRAPAWLEHPSRVQPGMGAPVGRAARPSLLSQTPPNPPGRRCQRCQTQTGRFPSPAATGEGAWAPPPSAGGAAALGSVAGGFVDLLLAGLRHPLPRLEKQE